ncbi:FAD-binding oxidoreductase [Mesorhizobium sp. B2-5-13]|uniref:NAD(P)/FAD-dependent oxidoreductase n=1 Tax=unclassified Mesorhizobium TaxID=325217 RepID=UPI00112939A1|nr:MULTISPECIES: FAD-dependent oxidoreductase [unclassified Mesorhizobium]TPJ81927.1 FAD-binding oxidoreductase [Mesorhizobium sp. B2-5-13]TPK45864.1 FAD-binding oxidoreductase [Mesorhizobium sp. B2-5-5]
MPLLRETVLIVGAGLHGCAIALFLARAGAKVVVIEKNTAGRHASGVNAGGLRTLMRDVREYPLSQRAMALWGSLEDVVGSDGARAAEVRLGAGQVAVAFDEAEIAWAEARSKDVRKRGLGDEELLSADDVRRLLPGISATVLGGLIVRGDGHANPAGAMGAFRDAAKRAGVTIVENSRVLGLDRARGGGWKAETTSGVFEGGILINCAGAWGRNVAALVDEDLPLAVAALSMMVTIRVQPFVTPVVVGIDRTLSFKQSAAGSLVIGGGIFGNACTDRDTSFTIMDRMAQSAAATVAAFPALEEIPILRTWTGLEGLTPDGVPIIGPGVRHPDLWHVFGFCGHGFQLAPAVGEAVMRSLAEGQTSNLLAPFSPQRFTASSVRRSKGAA